MLKKYSKIYFCAVMILIVMPQLSAHPHMFIAGLLKPKISSDKRYLQGVEVRWSFDQIYSSQMILDFDSNKNSKIDKAEGEKIYQHAFVHLKELNYFLEVQKNSVKNKKSIKIGEASDFQASIEDNMIIYQFYVPFIGDGSKGVPLSHNKEYIIYLEDNSYFIAFDTQLKPGIKNSRVKFSNKKFTVQNSQWGPYSVRVVSVKSL